MKIIKKGIEKRFYPQTTDSLKGYIVKKHGVELFVIDDIAYSNTIGNVVAGVYKFCGVFLLLSFSISECDIITPGAIVDEKGVEQTKIKIVKYI